MKKMVSILILAVSLGTIAFNQAYARSLRATDLKQDALAQAMAGTLNEDLTIEFRQGDQLPFIVRMEGDIAESVNVVPSIVAVKRHFFLRYQQAGDGTEVFMSWDGTNYRPVHELVAGTITAGATGDGPDNSSGIANAIGFAYKWLAKP